MDNDGESFNNEWSTLTKKLCMSTSVRCSTPAPHKRGEDIVLQRGIPGQYHTAGLHNNNVMTNVQQPLPLSQTQQRFVVVRLEITMKFANDVTTDRNPINIAPGLKQEQPKPFKQRLTLTILSSLAAPQSINPTGHVCDLVLLHKKKSS